MKYRVYQIHLSSDERLALNALGREEAAKQFRRIKAYNEVMWSGGSKYFRPAMRTAYDETLVIEANDLNEVFEVGNIGPQREGAAILPLRKFHSVSVGDVIVDEEGTAYMVDPYGFTEVSFMVRVPDAIIENARRRKAA